MILGCKFCERGWAGAEVVYHAGEGCGDSLTACDRETIELESQLET